MPDIVEKMVRIHARKAIDKGKIWEYYLFWSREPIGWQRKAQKILREELKRKGARDGAKKDPKIREQFRGDNPL